MKGLIDRAVNPVDTLNLDRPLDTISSDNPTKFKISVFGIGYVGTVTAACLARDGPEVVAVDVNQDKVETINRGQSPIIEPRLGESILSGVRSGRLKATNESATAVLSTDISLI